MMAQAQLSPGVLNVLLGDISVIVLASTSLLRVAVVEVVQSVIKPSAGMREKAARMGVTVSAAGMLDPR